MSGIMQLNMSHKPVGAAAPVTGAQLVLDLDAANYSAVPVNGSTIAGTGAYPITVLNPNSRISWSSDSGGLFRVSTASTQDMVIFGPDFSSSTQAYTVGMAYKWNGATAGRLLNANTSSPDFLLGLWGSGTCRMNIAFAGTFTGLNSTLADTAWHFIWFTCTGTVSATRSKKYIATSVTPILNSSAGGNTGFNGLRLFGRFSNSTTSVEPVDADVGFVKLWNGELNLAEVQAQHAFYKTRFGY